MKAPVRFAQVFGKALTAALGELLLQPSLVEASRISVEIEILSLQQTITLLSGEEGRNGFPVCAIGERQVMANAHRDTDVSLALVLCRNKHVSVDDQSQYGGAVRLCCQLFQDRLGNTGGTEIVKNLPGEGDEARTQSVSSSIGVPLNQPESPQRFQYREGLAFVESHPSTDLDETHVGGPRVRQAEQYARGLLYRRNQISFF